MKILAKYIGVAAIATCMAILGMELIALADGRHTNKNELFSVIPRSIILWMLLGSLLRFGSLGRGIYLGLLSPFIGALTFIHWGALAIVLMNLGVCISIGVATGVLVSIVIRDRPAPNKSGEVMTYSRSAPSSQSSL